VCRYAVQNSSLSHGEVAVSIKGLKLAVEASQFTFGYKDEAIGTAVGRVVAVDPQREMRRWEVRSGNREYDAVRVGVGVTVDCLVD